jgi:hypothetical protein
MKNYFTLTKVRSIIQYILPRPLLSVLYYTCSFFVFIKNFIFFDEFKKVPTTNSGIAYLLATGPSIKSIDIFNLTGKKVFTVSNFVLHDSISEIKPIGHFIAAIHPPLDLDGVRNWFNIIDAKLPSDTFIISDSRNKYLIEGNYFVNRKVFYLQTFPMLDLLFIKIPYITPRPWSVPQLALPFIFHMGFDEIILCGCDHTVLANYGAEIKHFYRNSDDPRIGASDKLSWEDGGIIKQLENNAELFKLYRSIQKFYFRKNKKIYRLTSDGWLDFIKIKK